MKNLKKSKILSFALVLIFLATFILTPLHVSAASGSTFREAAGITQQYRVTGSSAWKTLTPSTSFNGSDGILIQTANKPYYLKYKCKDNSHGWLDPVRSTDSGTYDYAGWPGYSVTNISIEVYDYTGRIYDNYVVMYRAKVAGAWLDWVSNGTPTVMQTIKSEFGLSGTLDTSSTDAGWARKGVIQALEIRVFERIENYPTPSANAKIIDAPYIYQGFNYPNGCESVSTVMALQHAGINISVDSFIDNYLDMGAAPVVGGSGPDPDLVYCGNPRSVNGWGCYSPVIVNALNKFVDKNTYTVSQFYGKSLDELCRTYIDNNVPVIMWATVGMTDSSASSYYAHWTSPAGKSISYNRKLHCVLLVGYDENNYYFNDPLHMDASGVKYTGYAKTCVEKAYSILNQQSIVVAPK